MAVEEVLDSGEYEKLYNLRVADWHTYFVGSEEWGFSVWAHNACNANSTLSRRLNHIYAIYSSAGKLLKYGVSASKVTSAGQSYRALRQTAGSSCTTSILGWLPGPARRLAYEEMLTRLYQAANGGLRPPWMIRP